MPSETTIHVAIELSVSSWLVATRQPGAEKSRLHHIEGGDTTALVRDLHDGAGVIVRDLPGTGTLRASVGWWNDEDDLARLVGALRTFA